MKTQMLTLTASSQTLNETAMIEF